MKSTRFERGHKLMPGVKVYFRASSLSKIEMNVEMKWYGKFLLFLKCIRKEYKFKWYQYPFVILTILCECLKKD
jgi:hypothetical protein